MSEQKRTTPKWMEDHIKLYLNDPEKAHMWDSTPGGGTGPVPTLLLTTKGRKTGKVRHNPLIYTKTSGGFVVIASKGGWPEDPGWYSNLKVDPEVEIQVGRDHYRARARTAGPEERLKLWSQMARVWPSYDAYQAKAGRTIPVVVLEPVKA